MEEITHVSRPSQLLQGASWTKTFTDTYIVFVGTLCEKNGEDVVI